MGWEAVSAILGAVGLVAGGLGFLAKREADRVLAPRVDCNSYLDDGGQSVTSLYKVAGPNSDLWSVESVRVSSPNAKLATMARSEAPDEYGNLSYAPGAWDSYLDLSDYYDGDGIVTSPADQNVRLVFTLVAKSDSSIQRDAPVVIKAKK